jgi:hypothetical protein
MPLRRNRLSRKPLHAAESSTQNFFRPIILPANTGPFPASPAPTARASALIAPSAVPSGALFPTPSLPVAALVHLRLYRAALDARARRSGATALVRVYLQATIL